MSTMYCIVVVIWADFRGKNLLMEEIEQNTVEKIIEQIVRDRLQVLINQESFYLPGFSKGAYITYRVALYQCYIHIVILLYIFVI